MRGVGTGEVKKGTSAGPVAGQRESQAGWEGRGKRGGSRRDGNNQLRRQQQILKKRMNKFSGKGRWCVKQRKRRFNCGAKTPVKRGVWKKLGKVAGRTCVSKINKLEKKTR